MPIAIIKGHMQKRYSKQWHLKSTPNTLQNLYLHLLAVNRVLKGFQHIQQHARLAIKIHKAPVIIYIYNFIHHETW